MMKLMNYLDLEKAKKMKNKIIIIISIQIIKRILMMIYSQCFPLEQIKIKIKLIIMRQKLTIKKRMIYLNSMK